ncbi:hypothetical protein GMD78_19370 [Ornithinibacillus sp. L9]|uniref:Uncharacterized protein n=1 Tax=Ornithinibacillus caprae TaxID=2678566 RepID=A0A6N8FLJ8_9BACI|nr:hypothetical protein [Ornithinibacillus caprae]MUK90520.1 hypothetical protein [Ornithinibacillus caprae]
MEEQTLHQQIQQASQQIADAQQAFANAQGNNVELLKHANEQLQHAEQALQDANKLSGEEATRNPQFQQAYQRLHDTRQQMQEAKQKYNF